MTLHDHRMSSPLWACLAMLVGVLALIVALPNAASAQNTDVGAQFINMDYGDPLTANSVNVNPGRPAIQQPTVGQDNQITLESQGNTAQFSVNLDGLNRPSESINILIMLTMLSLVPSFLMLFTSFTRIVIVLSATRNAVGLPTVPPTQVVVGLALFLSFFTMTPTITAVNDNAIQPYLRGELGMEQTIQAASTPVREFMMSHVGESELELFIGASRQPKPETPADVTMTTLIPAFLLSELKTAFIMVFAINVPFLVVDLIVASVLMSMGMMMLPPVMVSLPFKLLLFVMVDGWRLVIESLLRSFT